MNSRNLTSVLMFISTIPECIFSYPAPWIEYHHPGFISSGGEGSSITKHNSLSPVIRDCAQGTVLEGSEQVAGLLIGMSSLPWRQIHRIRPWCTPKTVPFQARIPSSKGEVAPPSGESKYSALRSSCLQNPVFPSTD